VQNSQKDFFISYNKADVLWGTWIAWQLEEAGFTTSLQAWDFLPGENFVIGMHKAMAGATHTIAVLSPDYLDALFTQPEWAAAFERDPTGAQRTLIPVRVRPCDLTGLLASIIYIDLVSKEESVARQLLLDGVSRQRGKPNKPPSFPGSNGNASASASGENAPILPKKALYPGSLSPVTKAIKVFTLYAPKDASYLLDLEKQLTRLKKQGMITTWDSSKILPGYITDHEIEKHLNAAQLILPLISADLLADDDSYDLLDRAMSKHTAGTAHVVPILLRPCDSGLEKFEVLPSNKDPISKWSRRDDAFMDITQGIRKVVEDLLLAN